MTSVDSGLKRNRIRTNLIVFFMPLHRDSCRKTHVSALVVNKAAIACSENDFFTFVSVHCNIILYILLQVANTFGLSGDCLCIGIHFYS